MKVYTKTGDKGTTSLIGGTRVPKDDARLNAYGTVDELNSFIGLLVSFLDDKRVCDFLANIQNILFDIGGILATDTEKTQPYTSITEDDIKQIESEIDFLGEELPALKSFVIPGGTKAAAMSHVCRTVARRTERKIYTMKEKYFVDENVLIYVNRLSDYFFVLARFLNKHEESEKYYVKR